MMEIVGKEDNGDSVVEFLDWKEKRRRTKKRERTLGEQKREGENNFFFKWFELNYKSSK